jgi:predicted RNase H-like HicB family nuclease
MQKRMKTLIQLKIEKFEEEGHEYFVATSDELQGLVAEGETIDKTIEIAEDVARILIEFEKEQKGNHINLRTMPQNFEYPLILEV